MFFQSSISSNPSPLLYVHPAELMYHPAEPIENGCVWSALPLMEAGVPEVAIHTFHDLIVLGIGCVCVCLSVSFCKVLKHISFYCVLMNNEFIDPV